MIVEYRIYPMDSDMEIILQFSKGLGDVATCLCLGESLCSQRVG